MSDNENKNIMIYPMIPLRGITVFPHMTIHFDVGREKSVAALESAMESDQKIFLVTQKEAVVEEPGSDDIYKTGTLSKVKQLLRLPGKTVRVLVEGIERGEIVSYVTSEPFMEVEVDIPGRSYRIPSDREEALRRRAVEAFESYAALAGRISPDTVFSIITTEDTDKLSDMIAGSMTLKVEQRQELLRERDSLKRLSKLLPIIHSEIQILELESIHRFQIGCQFFPTFLIKKMFQSPTCTHPHVIITLGTDMQVALDFGAIEDRTAGITLGP